MANKVFLSFEYRPDVSRVQQVRNMGAIEDKPLLTSNEWEEIKQGGKSAIQEWIDDQMKYKNCVVVLIGATTAGREWVEYEFKHGWQKGKGVVGIHIHNLKDFNGYQSSKGKNPFSGFAINDTDMTDIVKSYDPPYSDSKSVYDYIKTNINGWVDEAKAIRNRY